MFAVEVKAPLSLRLRTAAPPPRGVDTAEDLAAVDALLVLSLP